MTDVSLPREAPGRSGNGSDALPLAVDLDGTLIRSDSLHEGIVGALKAEPRALFAMLRTLGDGKAAFKRAVTTRVTLDPALLPYDANLLAYLRAEKENGRRIGLFTAADQSIADGVAAHLGLFDVARGSDGRTNLGGATKAAAIREAFGEHFAYVGDAPADVPVFAAADRVVLVGEVERLRAALPAGKTVEAMFARRRAGPRTWIKALRLQHWVKNILVLVAPVLGFQADSPRVLAEALLLFVLMGLLASATYILNDLLDLAADRQHPKKRFRPLAAGTITPRDGVLVAALMIGAVGLLSLLLPVATLGALLAYLLMTLAYSLILKRIAMIDVLMLAALFTIRVWAGATLQEVPASPWLLTFSMLFFLGLAMIKRYAELERVLRIDAELGRARGYTGRDLPILLATGVASGISAVVIFTIYLINEQYPRHIYRHPGVLWCIMPLLLAWTLRIWHLSVHGRMNEDPVVFALQDRFSLSLGVVVAAILLIAWM